MEDSRMHLLRRVLLAAMVLLGMASLAAADDRVAVMLRSGEKLSGRFDGVSNGQFNLDISDTDERKIPMGDIALIDMVGGASGLPETELSQARTGAHVLLMKNGTMTKGSLVRIDGSRVNEQNDLAYVVFRTEGGEERRVAMRDVGRLYLGNYPGAAPAAPAPTPTSPGTSGTAGQTGDRVLTLPANLQWLDTGVTVRQGQQLGISATGEITLSADGNDKAGPSGAFSGRMVARAPLPTAPAGALIGRIGNGRPFGIGAGPSNISAPGAGRLYLGINDDNVSDNAGQYQVHLGGAGAGSQQPTTNNNRNRSNTNDNTNGSGSRRRRP
jgi:small nuclear ribonucleoprotein (snRNP)-like protein